MTNKGTKQKHHKALPEFEHQDGETLTTVNNLWNKHKLLTSTVMTYFYCKIFSYFLVLFAGFGLTEKQNLYFGQSQAQKLSRFHSPFGLNSRMRVTNTTVQRPWRNGGWPCTILFMVLQLQTYYWVIVQHKRHWHAHCTNCSLVWTT